MSLESKYLSSMSNLVYTVELLPINYDFLNCLFFATEPNFFQSFFNLLIKKEVNPIIIINSELEFNQRS